MNFWKEYNSCSVVYESTVSELADKYDVELISNEEMDEKALEWFNLVHILSKVYGLSEVYEACLIYYVTSYFTDNGVSAGVEDEYFKQSLDKHIFDLYIDAKECDEDEVVQKRVFLESLLSLFNSHEIVGYEKHIFLHNIRVSSDIKKWFDSFGNTRKTVMALIDGRIEHPHLNMNAQPLPCNIFFVLSYSEEAEWSVLSDINDGDRLRVLLY